MTRILVMKTVVYKLRLRGQGTDHSLRTEGEVQVLLGAFGPGTAAAETTAVKAAAANEINCTIFMVGRGSVNGVSVRLAGVQ